MSWRPSDPLGLEGLRLGSLDEVEMPALVLYHVVQPRAFEEGRFQPRYVPLSSTIDVLLISDRTSIRGEGQDTITMSKLAHDIMPRRLHNRDLKME